MKSMVDIRKPIPKVRLTYSCTIPFARKKMIYKYSQYVINLKDNSYPQVPTKIPVDSSF